MKAKILLSLIFTLCASSLWAYDVVVDGIYYRLAKETSEAIVVSGDNTYSGEIIIPMDIESEGVSFCVSCIGDSAFYECVDLTNITIPNSVKRIGQLAFFDCWNMENITLPNSIISIGRNAFSQCSLLKNISIPNSVTSIGAGAFSGCGSLLSIDIPENLTEIEGYTFSSCYSLENITLPNSIISIGDRAFYWCLNLRSISIPKSVTSIGMFAFDCCDKLETVIIPNSVTSVGQNAFSKCSNLKEVFCYAEKVPSLNSSVFYHSNIENSTLWIPEASVVEYMSADQWKDFGTIKFIEGTNVIPLNNMNDKTKIYNINGSLQKERTNGFNIIQNTNVKNQKVFIK